MIKSKYNNRNYCPMIKSKYNCRNSGPMIKSKYNYKILFQWLSLNITTEIIVQ
jgi:hypothetical protein